MLAVSLWNTSPTKLIDVLSDVINQNSVIGLWLVRNPRKLRHRGKHGARFAVLTKSTPCIQLIEDVVYIACSWLFSFPIGGKFNAIRTIGERMWVEIVRLNIWQDYIIFRTTSVGPVALSWPRWSPPFVWKFTEFVVPIVQQELRTFLFIALNWTKDTTGFTY